jgi:hypothetical protein
LSRRAWVVVAAGAVALVLCVLLARWLHPAAATSARAPVPGGDAGGLARALPADERIDAVALERVLQEPVAAALAALVVMRDDHLVFERYGRGYGPDTMIDGGHFAEALLAMITGVAAQQGMLVAGNLHGFDPAALRGAIEAGSKLRYETYLSRRLWSPINAAPAWIDLPAAGAPVPVDCCFHARVIDWLRIAGLLLDDGRFEGKQVLPPGWVQRMARPVSLDSVQGFGVQLGAAARGTEPFAASGVLFLRGPERWRLWLLPSLRLAVLFGASAAPAASADETRLPNLVIRAVLDRPPQPEGLSDLQRLVPGH